MIEPPDTHPFFRDPEFRKRYLIEGHKCERLATIQSQVNNQGYRTWWVGKLLSEIEGFPGEEFCLHIETPLKKVVFVLDRGDVGIIATVPAVMLGKAPHQDWVQMHYDRTKKGKVAFGEVRQCQHCEYYYQQGEDPREEEHMKGECSE